MRQRLAIKIGEEKLLWGAEGKMGLDTDSIAEGWNGGICGGDDEPSISNDDGGEAVVGPQHCD